MLWENSPEPPGSTVIASSNVSEHNGSYEHNLNEELLAFLKGQPGSLWPFIFPFILEILGGCPFQTHWSGKLLNKRAQNAGGISANDACGDLRIPCNSINIETLDDFQSQCSSFFKIHSPGPSRRLSLIRCGGSTGLCTCLISIPRSQSFWHLVTV